MPSSAAHLNSDSVSRERSTLKVTLAFLCVYLIWGSTYLAIRYAIETLPGLLMAGARYVTAGGFVYLWGARSDPERPTARAWREAFILGALFFLGGNGAVVWAETRVPSGVTSLLIATMPLWVVLLDSVRPGGSRPHGIVLGGLALGFCGLLLLLPLGPIGAAGSIDVVGALALVAGALSWATGSLYALRAELPRSLLLASGMEMIAGGVLLSAAGLLCGEWQAVRLDTISLRSVAALAYLVVFGSIVAFNAFTYLLEVEAPARVSTYAYVNPVVAVILGWLLAGEALGARTITGAAVIVAAVAIVTAGRAAESHEREPVRAPVAELAEGSSPPS
jgi:drug/metabolite transporter (DMT)-like permease